LHQIPEDAPGAALTSEAARLVAEQFLAGQTIWKDSKWEPISVSSEEKPGGRVDHTFTYRRTDFTVGESQLRITVVVQGDRIGSYNYYLKIPESFERYFISQSNRAGFINNICFFLGYLLFAGAAFAAFIFILIRRGSETKGTILVMSIIGGITLLSYLNTLPLYSIGYSTTEDYSLFWINNIIYMVISTMMNSILAGVLWMGGHNISKLAWPRQDRVLPRNPDRLVALSQSTWRGLMMAGISIGYVIVFYLIAERFFGGWTPMDTSYSNLYATPFPFLYALEIGVVPALTEELMFRLIGISLIYWAFKKRWLALLIPGALWAFAHTAYVRDPIYLRGIELTIAAIFIYGLFFLKYDLATTIIGHFAFNAGLVALPLLFSGTPYYVLSGSIVILSMLAPGIPGLVVLIRRKIKKLPEPSLPRIEQVDASVLSGLPDWPAALVRPDAMVLGLKVKENIVGAISGTKRDDGNGQVDAIYVAPAWRRQYWGSRLTAALVEQMQALGMEKITTEVTLKDKKLHAFWAFQNWEPVSQTLNYTPPQSLRQILTEWRNKLKKKNKPS
jgi:hypothetical protein